MENELYTESRARGTNTCSDSHKRARRSATHAHVLCAHMYMCVCVCVNVCEIRPKLGKNKVLRRLPRARARAQKQDLLIKDKQTSGAKGKRGATKGNECAPPFSALFPPFFLLLSRFRLKVDYYTRFPLPPRHSPVDSSRANFTRRFTIGGGHEEEESHERRDQVSSSRAKNNARFAARCGRASPAAPVALYSSRAKVRRRRRRVYRPC